MAIAKGIAPLEAPPELAALDFLKEGERQAHDFFGVSTAEPGNAGLDRLRALGFIPHDDNGNAKRWSFFLNSARIGQNQISLLHKKDKSQIVERLNQMHALEAG